MLNRHFSCFTHAVFPAYDLPEICDLATAKVASGRVAGNSKATVMEATSMDTPAMPDGMVQNHQAWFKILGKSWETMEVS